MNKKDVVILGMFACSFVFASWAIIEVVIIPTGVAIYKQLHLRQDIDDCTRSHMEVRVSSTTGMYYSTVIDKDFAAFNKCMYLRL